MEKVVDPARNARGEYKQWLHVFTLTRHREDTGVRWDEVGPTLGDHYCYPWPVTCVPSMGYIDAVKSISRFQHWPSAWKSFVPELANLYASSMDRKTAIANYGPYMLLQHGPGTHHISGLLVAIKRPIRVSHLPAKTAGETLTRAVLDHFAPYYTWRSQGEVEHAYHRSTQSRTGTL